MAYPGPICCLVPDSNPSCVAVQREALKTRFFDQPTYNASSLDITACRPETARQACALDSTDRKWKWPCTWLTDDRRAWCLRHEWRHADICALQILGTFCRASLSSPIYSVFLGSVLFYGFHSIIAAISHHQQTLPVRNYSNYYS